MKSSNNYRQNLRVLREKFPVHKRVHFRQLQFMKILLKLLYPLGQKKIKFTNSSEMPIR